MALLTLSKDTKKGEKEGRYSSVLILTCSAGGGHLQAANAKKLSLQEEMPAATIFQIDLLSDWVGKLLGKSVTFMWNHAQKSDSLLQLLIFGFFHPLVDRFFNLLVFPKAVSFLLKNNIEAIIDTQPMCTSAILKAIRWIAFRYGKTIYYEKVFTDLPTDKTTLYFSPLKRLSKADQKHLRVSSAKPLLKPGESPESFWQTYGKISESLVNYAPFPIRPAFLKYTNSSFDLDPATISIKTHCETECELIKQSLDKINTPFRHKEHTFYFTLYPEDHVSLIMLGANPPAKTYLAYLSEYLSIMAHKKNIPHPHFLFLFCSNAYTKSSLQKEIFRLIQNYHPFPTNFFVIAASHQESETVAPLLARSNTIITKAGGITSMELLTVAKGNIWIHEHRSAPVSFFLAPFCKKRAVTMPLWELGNADYLRLQKGAQFITPESLKKALSPHL